MKRYDVDYAIEVKASPYGDWILYVDIFPTGPDNKRHPTVEEIECLVDSVVMEYKDMTDHPAIEMLRRLATVAPKEE